MDLLLSLLAVAAAQVLDELLSSASDLPKAGGEAVSKTFKNLEPRDPFHAIALHCLLSYLSFNFFDYYRPTKAFLLILAETLKTHFIKISGEAATLLFNLTD